MRVADNMNYSQVIQNLNRNRKDSADLNNQAATMKRITKPSDDPAGTARVLSSRTDIAAYTQYEKSLNYSKSFLDYSEQSLSELGDLMIRLKELAVGQANEAGANADTRRSTAAEVEQAYQQSLQIGNRKIGDRYLFGGFKTQAAPFSGNGQYNGDDGELMIEIDKGSYLAMNLPGDKVFLGKGFAVRRLGDVNENVPKTAEEVAKLQEAKREIEENGQPTQKPQQMSPSGEIRGPAAAGKLENNGSPNGENIFSVIRGFHTALVTNDTEAIQNSLERLDESISQVVMARSQLGSRVMTLNNTLESLGRQSLDSKALASSIEDANAFELFSDMSKNETTLKATLDSSGRLITPSLLDFLR